MAGIFGAPLRYDTPQLDPLPQSVLQIAALPQQPAKAKKPGFNDPGGLGDNLRTFAAHLMQAGGNLDQGNALLSEVQQRGELNRQMQLEMAKRQLSMMAPQKVGNDLVQMQPDGTYKALYQGQPSPTEFQRTLEAGGYIPGSPEYTALARQKAQADAMGAPVVYDQYNPQTQTMEKVIAPRSQVYGGAQQAPAGPPDAAIAYLRQNPALASQFDAKYGVGAAARILGGGAAPQAPAPFPTR